MHIRCPHCHNPIDVVESVSFNEICCPSCGSSFSLISGDTTETYRTGTRRLAHFELVRELGIGKFGSVWMARDTELDRTVAIKIPRKGSLSADETELFLRDARAAAQLKHPNIVSVHEVGREDGTVYIVSDYVEGANLRERLSAGRLSFRESAELIVKLAEAVHHAHESGVVHRDLKPGNIMLDSQGQPHVIDFGLAKRDAGEITMTVDGQILGTPAYMSPEQAGGKGHAADRRSDVYSLGVILFELLTGELPFRGEKQILITQIQRDEPRRPRKLNAKIPRDLETITLKCLEKEQSRRYPTAQSLADDLKHWLDGKPILARTVGRTERLWRWARRNPLVAALSITVLSLTVMVGVVSYERNVTMDVADELSPDEIGRLERRVAFLQHDADILEARAEKGAASKVVAVKNAYELASATAVLGWVKGDSQLAVKSMDDAIANAQEYYTRNFDAFFELGGAVTLDQVGVARDELVMTELARARLKRSLAGEPTNWFRIALLANRRTRADRLNNVAAPFISGSPVQADEIQIFEPWVNVQLNTWRIIQANVQEGRGYSKAQELEAVYQLFAARAQLAYLRRDFAQALADQRSAVDSASDWSAEVLRSLALGQDGDNRLGLESQLRLADQSREEAAAQLNYLEKAAKPSSETPGVQPTPRRVATPLHNS